MPYQPVDVFVQDTTPSKNPVSGVVVKILSLDGKLVFGQSTTDASGHAGFLLPDGQQYQLRSYKFATGFVNPQLFTVLPSPLQPGQTNAFNVTASILTPPVPTDARLCTAFGFFRDITGAPQPNVDIHIIAKFDPVWLEGAGVVKERVIIRTDENGYAQVNLIRNGQYNVTIQGEEDVNRRISVPDAPNVNLPDLIFPIVQQVIFSPPGPAITLKVGQELFVGVTVIASDGENLGVGVGDVMYASTSTDVFGFSCSNAGLTLIGVGLGTAQLTLTRADQSIVHIPQTDIQGSPLTVTVTP